MWIGPLGRASVIVASASGAAARSECGAPHRKAHRRHIARNRRILGQLRRIDRGARGQPGALGHRLPRDGELDGPQHRRLRADGRRGRAARGRAVRNERGALLSVVLFVVPLRDRSRHVCAIPPPMFCVVSFFGGGGAGIVCATRTATSTSTWRKLGTRNQIIIICLNVL